MLPVQTACRNSEVTEFVAQARRNGQSVGVVPTMGALHSGHLSLIDAARAECDVVIVTLFVNPTQFAPDEDFEKYPRPLESDLSACADHQVDLVFHPEPDEIYPFGFCTTVKVAGLTRVLEGAHRPTHFDGVTTVVLKLLNITQADTAFFGAKDYQQQLIVRRMCRDLNMQVVIRTCPIIRDADGLALSSRNKYLSSQQRQSALSLSQTLFWAEQELQQGRSELAQLNAEMVQRLENHTDVLVDYAVVADPESLELLQKPRGSMVLLLAAQVGTTRLIDNLIVNL